MTSQIPNLILPGEEQAAEPVKPAAPAAQAAVQAAPAKAEEKPMEPVAEKEDSLNFDNLSEQEQAAAEPLPHNS